MVKKRTKASVKIELSNTEATYLQGMVAAYKQRLKLDEKAGGNLIIQELKKAQKIEKKLLTA